MKELQLEDLGIQKNPFETIIANDESSHKYTLYGRETEIERFSEFIHDATKKETQQRVMVMGEYGTGKTHHLMQLMHNIDSGVYGENLVGIYLGSLGISFKRLYENILQKTSIKIPELGELIEELGDVEPGDSVERTYATEKLRDNIIDNLGKMIAGARTCGIRGIILLIDEAEDIAQSDNTNDVQYFVTSLLHLINTLQGTTLHIIMGFSREAMSKISNLEGKGPEDGGLGEAFLQRFPNKIQLGYLSKEDARLMILDRLNSVRFTKNDSFYPINPGVVDVVSRLVSGHPREILAIMDQALRDALLTGEREITGTQIIQILAKHESYYSKSFILDWNSLNSLIEDICAKNSQLGEDFRRLSGKLIGEDGALSEDDFSDSEFPELLTQPINGIRILERKNSNFGEVEYTIHPDVSNEIFKEKRYNSDIELAIEREIIEIINYPEKYQNQLTYGLWKTFQKGWKAEFNNKLQFGSSIAIIGNVKISSSTTPVSVVFTAYKGKIFPEELYSGLVQTLESRQAGFAYVLYGGPRLTTDAHYTRLRNKLHEEGKERFIDDILTVSIDNLKDEKNQFIGQIKYLGNREIKPSDEVNPISLFETLNAEEQLTNLIEEKALVYPEERVRSVVNYLAENNLKPFSIKDLKETLSDPYLDRDLFIRLEKQHFVSKQGAKWQIAQLVDDPPWKSINTFLKNKGPSSISIIREFLEEQYVFQCPRGDEQFMVTWYIQIMLNLAIIESVTEDIEPLYKIIDHSKHLSNIIRESEKELKSIHDLIKSTEPMQIPINDYRTKYEGFENRLDSLKDKYGLIGNEDVLLAQNLFTEITNLESNINGAIKKHQSEQESRYNNIKTQVELFFTTITNACDEGYFSENERNSLVESLNLELNKADEAINKKQYSALAISLNAVEQTIQSNRIRVEERKKSKDPCIQYSLLVTEQIESINLLFNELHDLGYENTSLNKRFEEAHSQYNNEYGDLFNAGSFTKAKICISGINNELTAILNKLRQKRTEYDNYQERISLARATVKPDNAELLQFIYRVEDFFSKWDFAQVETQLHLLEKKRKELHTQILPEDEFKESFNDHVLVKFSQLTDIYSIDEIFKHLKALYLKGDIENIEIKFRK